MSEPVSNSFSISSSGLGILFSYLQPISDKIAGQNIICNSSMHIYIYIYIYMYIYIYDIILVSPYWACLKPCPCSSPATVASELLRRISRYEKHVKTTTSSHQIFVLGKQSRHDVWYCWNHRIHRWSSVWWQHLQPSWGWVNTCPYAYGAIFYRINVPFITAILSLARARGFWPMHGHIETSSYHRMRNLTIKCQPECEFNLNEQVSTHPQSKHGSSRKTISTRKHWGCSREVSNLVSVSSSEVLTELIPCCYHRGKPTTTRHPSCCDERVLKITRKR